MEKLKKYNQIIFALVGTIALLFMLGVLSMFIYDEFFRTRSYHDTTLVAKEELDSLKSQNLRNQIVSLEKVLVLDTNTNTYLIPVYHNTLQDPSSRDSKVMGLLDTNHGSEYAYYGFGNYNNLLLHNFDSNETKILVNERLNIDNYNIFNTSESDKLIVFTGWDEDTNGDSKLSDKDFKNAYIYSHSDGQTKKIKNDLYKVISYKYLKKPDKLLFKVTENDSQLPERERPEFYVIYSHQENDLKPLINTDVINRLQEIIDN